MEAISELRFNALAGYARSPWTFITSIEHGWFSEQNEKVLGVVAEDTTDKDFACVVFGRDKVGRYRAVLLSEFFPTIGRARAAMTELLPEWAAKDPQEFEQGDEPRHPMDIFKARHPAERLHPFFSSLIAEEGYSPAKGIMEAMMYFFQDPDGNFAEQFQSTAFDARLWELYLFAVLAELRYYVDRTHPAPDFLCSGLFGEFFIEAMTVNATIKDGKSVETGIPKDPAEKENYFKNYLPIKFAGPLTTKLARKYWEEPHIAGRPIVFAVADFHYPFSMTWSQTALITYLYGREFKSHRDESGKLVLTSHPIKEHVWGTKTVPSGFFNLPDAENISAVISTREGTISKFNRMGMKAGFGSPRIRMVRKGSKYVHDPNRSEPAEYSAVVNDADYKEDWIEGLQVYHNANAKIPLNPETLLGATHHFLEGERMATYSRGEEPFGTVTIIVVPEKKTTIEER